MRLYTFEQEEYISNIHIIKMYYKTLQWLSVEKLLDTGNNEIILFALLLEISSSWNLLAYDVLQLLGVGCYIASSLNYK